MPNGFARSTAGEYTSNMFWIVGIALIASWIVAVGFTPYLGVKLLPEVKKVEGGHHAIYNTPTYNRFRRLLGRVVQHKWFVAAAVVGSFVIAIVGMGAVRKQFFPTSDRPEVLVDIQLPLRELDRGKPVARRRRSRTGSRSSRRRRSSPPTSVKARPLLPPDVARAPRSVVREDRRFDRERGGARGVEAPAPSPCRRRPCSRSSRSRHAAPLRPECAPSPSRIESRGRTRTSCARSPPTPARFFRRTP